MEAASKENGLSRSRGQLRAALGTLRLHYWFKNLLILVPTVLDRHFETSSLDDLVLAFLAFGFTASANYVLNDYIDRESDIARGRRQTVLSQNAAAITGICLSVLAILCASQLPGEFRWILAAYCGLCISYSLVLKRLFLVDLIVLAVLHLLRVVAGHGIIGEPISLLSVNLFGFLFLALVSFKRMTQLSARDEQDAKLDDRAYRRDHMSLLSSISIVASVLTLVALAFMLAYFHAESAPVLAWLVWPIAAAWLARAFTLARRGELNEDMVVFVLTDAFSLMSLAALAAIYAALL